MVNENRFPLCSSPVFRVSSQNPAYFSPGVIQDRGRHENMVYSPALWSWHLSGEIYHHPRWCGFTTIIALCQAPVTWCHALAELKTAALELLLCKDYSEKYNSASSLSVQSWSISSHAGKHLPDALKISLTAFLPRHCFCSELKVSLRVTPCNNTESDGEVRKGRRFSHCRAGQRGRVLMFMAGSREKYSQGWGSRAWMTSL